MPRKQFFDELSSRWDDMIDMSRVLFRLRLGLANMGIRFDEHILDLGCGTGNLSLCLLEMLGSPGRVHAVDLSPGMLDHAKQKLPDPRIQFHEASAEDLPIDSSSLDRAICFSTWPHISDTHGSMEELRRILRMDGWLHIWHIDSRRTINDIHGNAGEAVRSDLLPTAAELAEELIRHRFMIGDVIDNDYQYYISARVSPA